MESRKLFSMKYGNDPCSETLYTDKEKKRIQTCLSVKLAFLGKKHNQ